MNSNKIMKYFPAAFFYENAECPSIPDGTFGRAESRNPLCRPAGTFNWMCRPFSPDWRPGLLLLNPFGIHIGLNYLFPWIHIGLGLPVSQD